MTLEIISYSLNIVLSILLITSEIMPFLKGKEHGIIHSISIRFSHSPITINS